MALELTELNASGSSQSQLTCHLIIDAHIGLLEGLIRIRIVDQIIARGAANADHYLWRPIIINVKTTRKDFRTDEIGVVIN